MKGMNADRGDGRGEMGDRIPHVMHVVVSLAAGGLERLVVDWVNTRNAGVPGSTSVVCLDEPGELASSVEGACVHVVAARRSRFPFDVSAVWRLQRFLRREAAVAVPPGERPNTVPLPLVVHSHNLAAWQYAALAARGIGVPHVHTEHGSNPHHGGLINRLRNRFLLRATDAIVAVSRDTAGELTAKQRIPAGRILVIPNGVSLVHAAPSRAQVRERLGIPGDVTVIGTVGRLAEIKGQDRLIRAFAAMDGIGNAQLLIVGDGPRRDALKELASELGVSDRTIFSGFRPDARDCLAALDLFVLPSRSEGLPVALLEAMAADIPVAATSVGDVAQVLDSGRAGTLLPGNEGEWPFVLSVCLGDLSRVGPARERVREQYSQERTRASYESLYADLR